MDKVFVFNKSYQERLEEYQSILGGHEILPVSQLKKKWSHYMQLAIEPEGWKAIWKIPRIHCEELNIEFPTMVLVYVEHVDFDELTATVQVLAVQSDAPLPSKNKVGLVQLWITKEQDENFQSDSEPTAYALDMLQLFYIYLLLPWDYNEEEATDWMKNHLESRLRLYYDMRNGTIPRPVNERLKWLMNRARRLHALRENLTSNSFESPDGCNIQDLLEIHVEILEIRTEVQLLENPLLRNTYLARYHKLQCRDLSDVTQNWLVFNEGKIQDYLEVLKNAKDVMGDKSIKIVPTFSKVLETADTGDTILLNKDTHYVKDTAGLPSSVVVKGFTRNETRISNEKDGIMLDCFGNVTLENLTIDVNDGQCGIIIRSGCTTLKNCKIKGNDKTSLHRGVVVQSGSCLCMIDCEISGFYMGLFGNSHANINIRNCEISNSVIGLQILDDCTLSVEDFIFNNCKQFGIYVDTATILESGCYQKGNFSLLARVPDVRVKNINGKNTGNYETIILHKTEELLIDELFSISSSDQISIVEALNEEMDLNNTVIENNVEIVVQL